MPNLQQATSVENLLRELAPLVLGAVARTSGDFSAGEDAVQEALLAAALHWPRDGLPGNPRAWLFQTALRRLVDQRRSEKSRKARESLAVLEQHAAGEPDVTAHDDTLAVLFLCCHPELSPPGAIALTLRAVGGLSTTEIAAAFLVSEATMAQRISRAKQRIKTLGLRFDTLLEEDQRTRLPNVLRVLYLIFNEGYASTSGQDLQRIELAHEAIRLTRLAQRSLPENGEVSALLALMLLVDARRPARGTASGELVPLAEQDRTLWDKGRIAEGVALLDQAFRWRPIGEYHVQAAIAALHDQAPEAAATDWPQILALYGLLERLTSNPVVRLNRAVALAMVHGPGAALAVVDELAEPLAGHYRFDAVRAHLLEMAGDRDAAMAHYRAAAERTTNLPERRYLARQAARLRLQQP